MNFITQFISVFIGLCFVVIANKLWADIYEVLFQKKFRDWLQNIKDKAREEGQRGIKILLNNQGRI